MGLRASCVIIGLAAQGAAAAELKGAVLSSDDQLALAQGLHLGASRAASIEARRRCAGGAIIMTTSAAAADEMKPSARAVFRRQPLALIRRPGVTLRPIPATPSAAYIIWLYCCDWLAAKVPGSRVW